MRRSIECGLTPVLAHFPRDGPARLRPTLVALERTKRSDTSPTAGFAAITATRLDVATAFGERGELTLIQKEVAT